MSLAQFNSANSARQAYFGDENGRDGRNERGDGEEENGEGEEGEGGEEGEDGWTEWFRVDQVADWYVYGREALQEENVQFHVTGTATDGRSIYLDHSGEVVDEMVIFENMDEVNAALEAYFQREEDGDVPEDDQPTGDDPGPGQTPPGRRPGGSGGLPFVNRLPLIGNLGTMGQAIFVLIVLFGVYYYYYDGEVENLPVVGGEEGLLDDGNGGVAA